MIVFEVNQRVGNNISKAKWQNWLFKIGKTLKIKGKKRIDLAVIGKTEMRKWNKYYRRKNEVTDVLSFAEKDTKTRIYPKEYLGEIIICYPQAVLQAKKRKHSVEKEIQILLVHGFLHLLGYDHGTAKEEKEMKSLEMKILGEEGLI